MSLVKDPKVKIISWIIYFHTYSSFLPLDDIIIYLQLLPLVTYLVVIVLTWYKNFKKIWYEYLSCMKNFKLSHTKAIQISILDLVCRTSIYTISRIQINSYQFMKIPKHTHVCCLPSLMLPLHFPIPKAFLFPDTPNAYTRVISKLYTP
jgi:hypothetical protein